MNYFVRTLLVIGGLGMAALSFLFAFHQEWAAKLWLWADSPLSFYFVSAMQAAIAAAMLWIGFSGELRALAPGALNLVVMMAGCAISLFVISNRLGNLSLFYYALGCALFTLFNGWLFWWAQGIPLRDQRPLPGFVRFSYGLFVLILAAVGIALFWYRNAILPWQMEGDNKYSPLLFGWMFFGDAFYFLYALLYPRWHNACAQLCSFLAYDLVLLGPLLARWPVIHNFFPQVKPVAAGLEDNLIVYTLVLIYSCALGIFYLFIHPPTRLFGRAMA